MPTVMGSRMLLNLRGLTAATPDASELTPVGNSLPGAGARYECGAPPRARILPTLTQWTVSGEETIIARMQAAEEEKYGIREETAQTDDSSPCSSVGKGKGREMDLEMSPMSSSQSPGSDIINPVLPHNSHFGRYDV